MHDTAAIHEQGKAQYYWVWGILLGITAVEVALAYIHLRPVTMLTLLIGLSLVKAAFIILYFMHMKFETSAMKWVLMSSLVIVLFLMTAFFPDAFRLLEMRAN
jgi:cytochrome c oxidase subunit IV